MNTLQIGRARFSEIFWTIIDGKVDMQWHEIEQIIQQQQVLRAQADYNTGSLNDEDAAEVYRLVKFFKPDTIAEVGTFIGVSTRAMRLAAPSAEIYTCDVSNQIQVYPDDTKLYQYPKKTSTEMFKHLVEMNKTIDLVYLDGRLGQDDFEPLSKLVHSETVFVLDDFEGVEKGVANAMMLEGTGRILIYPRQDKKTAVSLPLSIIKLVPQEAV